MGKVIPFRRKNRSKKSVATGVGAIFDPEDERVRIFILNDFKWRVSAWGRFSPAAKTLGGVFRIDGCADEYVFIPRKLILQSLRSMSRQQISLRKKMKILRKKTNIK